ncbi:hypothetical protein SCP_0706030 [Sparassis crispa]|uniref:Uncharacterized protein n=1 Tax=Sparassis crispa TaxID=139825 RepID=A0A401GT79_9APHY|nr:hypothetical protein SCP_0706030 [Sparassis crispa]GBE85416.1 hypothetical protein SCP_0706030 [Sparassis crispa]
MSRPHNSSSYTGNTPTHKQQQLARGALSIKREIDAITVLFLTVAKLRKFTGVVVLTFKAIYALETKHRSNHKKAMALTKRPWVGMEGRPQELVQDTANVEVGMDNVESKLDAMDSKLGNTESSGRTIAEGGYFSRSSLGT